MATLAKKTRPVPHRDELVEQLAQQLANNPPQGQPRIYWGPTQRSGTRDVAVHWDRWKGIPFSDRSEIILDACERFRAGLRDQVYIATGRTTEEAIVLGYLPFRIAPVASRIAEEDWAGSTRPSLRKARSKPRRGCNSGSPTSMRPRTLLSDFKAGSPGPTGRSSKKSFERVDRTLGWPCSFSPSRLPSHPPLRSTPPSVSIGGGGSALLRFWFCWSCSRP